MLKISLNALKLFKETQSITVNVLHTFSLHLYSVQCCFACRFFLLAHPMVKEWRKYLPWVQRYSGLKFEQIGKIKRNPFRSKSLNICRHLSLKDFHFVPTICSWSLVHRTGNIPNRPSIKLRLDTNSSFLRQIRSFERAEKLLNWQSPQTLVICFPPDSKLGPPTVFQLISKSD
jgi:hypothetical protein